MSHNSNRVFFGMSQIDKLLILNFISSFDLCSFCRDRAKLWHLGQLLIVVLSIIAGSLGGRYTFPSYFKLIV